MLQILCEHGVLETEIKGIFGGQPGDWRIRRVQDPGILGGKMKVSDVVLYVGDKNVAFYHLVPFFYHLFYRISL